MANTGAKGIVEFNGRHLAPFGIETCNKPCEINSHMWVANRHYRQVELLSQVMLVIQGRFRESLVLRHIAANCPQLYAA